MIIGIDASRAFLKNRTGVEEYSYQVIKYLIPLIKDDQVILYIKKGQKLEDSEFLLPKNWIVKTIKLPYLWTQVGLSFEILIHPVNILFIPAHTVPVIHSPRTIVTIHGLEYEFCPEAYSFWSRWYMRWSIKNSCRWAKRIIAVSNNTKKDLVKLYKVPEKKIEVVYEGCGFIGNSQVLNSKNQINSKFLLFIGRLEERKNIVGIIKAFEILKKKYKISHKLVLAGEFGYGEKKIKKALNESIFKNDIMFPGYVDEEEKWKLLKNADVFLFPTFYEGFGLPVLEAQSVGVPVVAGNNSSIPEIIECDYFKTKNNIDSELNLEKSSSALLVDSCSSEQIAVAVYKLISDKELRNDIIKKGYENVKRFSWKRCSENVAKIIKYEAEK